MGRPGGPGSSLFRLGGTIFRLSRRTLLCRVNQRQSSILVVCSHIDCRNRGMLAARSLKEGENQRDPVSCVSHTVRPIDQHNFSCSYRQDVSHDSDFDESVVLERHISDINRHRRQNCHPVHARKGCCRPVNLVDGRPSAFSLCNAARRTHFRGFSRL